MRFAFALLFAATACFCQQPQSGVFAQGPLSIILGRTGHNPYVPAPPNAPEQAWVAVKTEDLKTNVFRVSVKYSTERGSFAESVTCEKNSQPYTVCAMFNIPLSAKITALSVEELRVSRSTEFKPEL